MARGSSEVANHMVHGFSQFVLRAFGGANLAGHQMPLALGGAPPAPDGDPLTPGQISPAPGENPLALGRDPPDRALKSKISYFNPRNNLKVIWNESVRKNISAIFQPLTL